MSTSISTVRTDLTENCSMIVQYGTRILMTGILLSLFLIIISKMYYKDCYTTLCSKCHKRKCKHHAPIEEMSNTNTEILQEDYTHINLLDHDKAMLTSPDSETQSYIISGEATRYIQENHGLTINIHCNLYLLNGNAYEPSIEKVHYAAYAVDPVSQKIILIGEMRKDNDNVYKLQKTFTQNLQKLRAYNIIQIAYHQGDKKTIMLQGQLKK